MPNIVWDDAFEATPAPTDEIRYGCYQIQDLKKAIRERLELEMNFKSGTRPLLKAGKASVLFYGTTAEINALTDVSPGALAWDTTLHMFKRYSGTAWITLTLDHADLSGLSADDHPQYLKLDKANQTLTQDLAVAAGKKIDGRDISVDGANLDTLMAKSDRPIMLATPVQKVNWTALTNWTTVSIASDTGSDTAKIAILLLKLYLRVGAGSTAYAEIEGRVRKTGSTTTAYLPRIYGYCHNIYNGGDYSAHRIGTSCMVMVECDANEQFDTALVLVSGTTPSNIIYTVDLIGYYK